VSESPPPQSNARAAIAEVSGIMHKLDPNMLAVLLLVVGMNGLFFWIYAEISKMRHVEFIAALNSCPSSPGVTREGTILPRYTAPGGMDR